jgi:hypothetical protein
VVSVRIAKVSAGGLASAAVIVMLSGCSGVLAPAPALTIYSQLTDRCFETQSDDDQFYAYVGVTIANPTNRDLILREVLPLELINASVTDISVAPVTTAILPFGVAPGGALSPEQRRTWNDRTEINGTRIAAGETAELLIEVHADDYTRYAGLRGLRVKYDDGWFSATSRSTSSVGFVPPWARCGARGH